MILVSKSIKYMQIFVRVPEGSAFVNKWVMKTAFFSFSCLLTYDVTHSAAPACTAAWRLETACDCAPAQPSRLLLWVKLKKSRVLWQNMLKCQIFNSNLTSTVQWN